MTKKIDKMRKELENVMYDIAIFLADERGLTYDQIRENFELSIDETMDLLDFQVPEISSNDV